jgi:hypothetical protein
MGNSTYSYDWKPPRCGDLLDGLKCALSMNGVLEQIFDGKSRDIVLWTVPVTQHIKSMTSFAGDFFDRGSATTQEAERIADHNHSPVDA